jgi:hypothetical protein
VGCNIDTQRSMLHCTIYVAPHNKASSKWFRACMAGMQARPNPGRFTKKVCEPALPRGAGPQGIEAQVRSSCLPPLIPSNRMGVSNTGIAMSKRAKGLSPNNRVSLWAVVA